MSKDRKILPDETSETSTDSFNNGMSPEAEEDICSFNPKLPSTAFIFDEKTGRFLVPRFQKMQDYLNYHFAERLGKRLCEAIDCETKAGIAETCTITEASFWREDYLSFIADLTVTIEVTDPSCTARFSAETYVTQVLINMYDETVTYLDDFRPMTHHYEHEGGIILSDYLVPIFSTNTVEIQAEDMLLRLAPDAYHDLTKNNAFNVAKALGLTILHYHLHKSKKRSTIFFQEGTIQAEDYNEDGKKVVKRIKIPADTVVMNSNIPHIDGGRLDLFHECFHYEWHYCFNKLMELHQRDIQQLPEKHTLLNSFNKKKRSPLSWAEWQARRGAYGLLVPRSIMSKKILEYLKNYQDSDWHMGRKLETVLRRIATELDMSKANMRARAIQIGYIEAKGALNYVDRRYIEPFAFDPENGGGNYTFVLDSDELFEVYQKSKKLQNQLFEQSFVYVDGHVCRNNPAFIESTKTGEQKLTKWANWHVDQCCLRFIQIYEDNEEEYTIGTLNCDDAYDRYFLGFIEGASDAEKDKQIDIISKRIADMPVQFGEALRFLMKEYDVTVESLAEKTTIPPKTIQRLRNEPRTSYPLDYIIAICIGMKLEPPISGALLLRAGYDLRLMPQNLIYQFILSCRYTLKIEEIQCFLKSHNQKPLVLTPGE